MYKALYRLFGGFIADVVAAIDQVCYKLVAEEYKILGGCSNVVSFVYMLKFYVFRYVL